MTFDIAYLAGLLDGEGHIGILRRKAYGPYANPRYSLRVEIGICSEETISWVSDRFNSNTYKKKPYRTARSYVRKVCFVASWSSNEALKILELTLPLLKAKRREALIAIAFQKDSPKLYGRRLSDKELHRRESAFIALRESRQ